MEETAASYIKHAIVVNQKLAFARILTDTAEQLVDDESIPARQSFHAYLSSAVFQLYDAVQRFIVENIVQTHPDFSVDLLSIKYALDKLSQQGIANDLTRELNQLVNAPSWLSELMLCQSEPDWLSQSVAKLNQDKTRSSSDRIPLVNADNGTLSMVPSGSPLALLNEWLSTIEKLIEHYRNLNVES